MVRDIDAHSVPAVSSSVSLLLWSIQRPCPHLTGKQRKMGITVHGR